VHSVLGVPLFIFNQNQIHGDKILVFILVILVLEATDFDHFLYEAISGNSRSGVLTTEVNFI
jgi:hypothetical protein